MGEVARCENPACRKPIKDSGPSTRFCNQLCSVAASARYSELPRTPRAADRSRDPLAADVRFGPVYTEKAAVDQAFDWLDVRASS